LDENVASGTFDLYRKNNIRVRDLFERRVYEGLIQIQNEGLFAHICPSLRSNQILLLGFRHVLPLEHLLILRAVSVLRLVLHLFQSRLLLSSLLRDLGDQRAEFVAFRLLRVLNLGSSGRA
jgi:hypothetical protein